MMNKNIMQQPKLEKVSLNIGGTGDKLERGFKLLSKLSGRIPARIKARKRIPTWGVRPGLEVGVKVTLRGKEAEEMLKKLLPAINNTLKEKQIRPNFLSFGIHEYIEIPGVEYIREVGIMGLEVTAVFSRAGKRIEKKKSRASKAKKAEVSAEEIIELMQKGFNTRILKINNAEEEK